MALKLTTRRRVAALLTVLALAGLATTALAQRRRGGLGGPSRPMPVRSNTPYDGRFTFVRVTYETAPGGFWWRGQPAWSHGYPIAEQNLMKIMNEVSYLGAREDEINTLAVDDPEISKYPVAYVIEVSWWQMTDREANALRAYIQKGGFVIVDDFKATGDFGSPGWEVFEANMRRVFPAARFLEMAPSHPVFHSFFEIETLAGFPQAYNAGPAVFRGMFQDNDPSKRLQMIVNYNTDISQFWEWSGRGFRPFDETNEAYKLGVNYLIYGLTH